MLDLMLAALVVVCIDSLSDYGFNLLMEVNAQALNGVNGRKDNGWMPIPTEGRKKDDAGHNVSISIAK